MLELKTYASPGFLSYLLLTRYHQLQPSLPETHNPKFFVTLPDTHVKKYFRMITWIPLLEIVTVTHTHTTNTGSQTARNLLANEAIIIRHGIENASEAEFVTNLLFPVDGETAFSATEIISV